MATPTTDNILSVASRLLGVTAEHLEREDRVFPSFFGTDLVVCKFYVNTLLVANTSSAITGVLIS